MQGLLRVSVRVVESFYCLLEHLGVAHVFVSLVVQSTLRGLVLGGVVDINGI